MVVGGVRFINVRIVGAGGNGGGVLHIIAPEVKIIGSVTANGNGGGSGSTGTGSVEEVVAVVAVVAYYYC